MTQFPANIDLSTLDGIDGFEITGAGRSVASAGDVNGDGFADLIVGYYGASPHSTASGASYVVFGHAGGFGAAIDVSSLDGSNGFRISGAAATDESGYSVASAGDVNGDGFADLIIGARYASPHGAASGASYVVFGHAGGFGADLDLSSLDGSNGFKLSGVAAADRSGRSVASAGDVNGDGFADLIVGAFGAGPHGSFSGASYVVFGSAGGFAANIDLSSLDGSNGFKLSGAAAGDYSGRSVASAGDVNGDGFADVIVGAYGVDTLPAGSFSGASYVVFGHAGGFAANIDLSSLDGSNGFELSGAATGGGSGRSVASAGDVNGDGYADLIIGAPSASPHGSASGASYVVFGHAGGFPANIDLSTLDGSNGFEISGAAAGDRNGYSVASAGDVNGDGFADLIIGAKYADSHGSNSGASYVVFGKAGGFGATIDLLTLDGSNGFEIVGAAAGDRSGGSVASAGDVNDDGFADLIVGAKSGSGVSYVIFGEAPTTAVDRVGTAASQTLAGGALDDTLEGLGGNDHLFGNGGTDTAVFTGALTDYIVAHAANGDTTVTDTRPGAPDGIDTLTGIETLQFSDITATLAQYPANIDLSSLDGSNGFEIDGAASGDQSGYSVASAGDVNGDGFDDVIVGALRAAPHGSASGASYVVFGKAGGFAATLDLSTLDGSNGFRLSGVAAGDYSGISVASAGDVNGDGFADLIIGAFHADPHGSSSGASYVVFGHAGGFDADIDLSTLDGGNGFEIDGAAAGDQSGYSVASAGDVNGDGFDDLIVGAYRAAPHGSSSGASYVVFGKAGGFSAAIDLSSLNGANGFQLSGAAASDESGVSVASAGDVNGDGFDDVIVGAKGAGPHGALSGASYVVFGQAGGFPANIDLSTLDGSNGFKLSGVTTADGSGWSVASAGDVNGDGYADLIIGASSADPHGSASGASYVVFGHAGGFAANIDLSTLDGSNGFEISGTAAVDRSGTSVASAGDVNGDGFDDLIIGAPQADPHGSASGASYVVFGQAGGFDANIDLSTLDGTNGFMLSGTAANGESGWRVAAAGDVNHDGFADLIVGAPSAFTTGSGTSYVIFGEAPTTAVDRVGTAASQTLAGGALDDTLEGLGGNDHLFGNGGTDTAVFTGALTDYIVAHAANGDTTVTDTRPGAPDGIDTLTGIETLQFSDITATLAQYPANIDLSSLDGSNGFTIDGVAAGDQSGWSVASAGDVNGDGFADLIVGTYVGSTSAASYVVFGHAGGFAATIDLSSLDGSNGFKISGAADGGYAGSSVASAGDVNGDGFADLIVGAPFATSAGLLAVASYVVFGHAGGFGANLDLSTLDGTNGFQISGAIGNEIGFSVASAGDVNNDGFADLIVGAPVADANGSEPGVSYVVFGHAGGFDANLDLSTLDGGNGFQITGVADEDYSGFSVASAGDVNGDGFADLIIGARRAAQPGNNSGASYVVFGKAGGFDANIDLSTLDGTNGFEISGAAAASRSGFSVASAGDVNGDGYADVIIGAPGASGGAGATYVVFGKAGGFDANIDLSTLDGTNGFKLSAGGAADQSGRSVASAGDVNGDGFADLIVGALDADPHASNSGASYVVFGHAGNFDANIALSSLDGSNGFKISGVAAGDYSGRSVASAGDVNGDGFSDLIIGADGADPNGSSSGASYVLFGQAPTTAVDRVGTAASQTLAGGAFDDTLEGLGGNDHLYGNGGTDTAVFTGVQADYTIARAANGDYIVTDTRAGSPDGTDTLTGIERLQFSDQTVAANVPPVIHNYDATFADDGTAPFSLQIALPTDPEGDTLTVTLDQVPDYGVVEYFDGAALVQAHAGDTLTPDELASLQYTPDGTGTHGGGSVVYSVSDGIASSTGSIAINDVAEEDAGPPIPLLIFSAIGPGFDGPDLFLMPPPGNGGPVFFPIRDGSTGDPAPQEGSNAGEDGGFVHFGGDLYFFADIYDGSGLAADSLVSFLDPFDAVTGVNGLTGQDAHFTPFAGALYFEGVTADGIQLAKMTPDETITSIDANPGANSNPGETGGLTVLDGSLYFSAFTPTSGTNNQDLVRLDADGTLHDITTRSAPGNGSAAGEDGGLFAYNHALYFNAISDTLGDTLFKLDAGSTTPEVVGSTVLAHDYGTPSAFHIYNGDLYFDEHSDALGADTLFKLDPQGNLTALTDGSGNALQDAGANGFADFNGSLYFSAQTDNSPFDANLYKLDPGGTVTEIDLNAGAGPSNAGELGGFATFAGALYFMADDYADFGTTKLFRLDATDAAAPVEAGGVDLLTTTFDAHFTQFGDSLMLQAETADGAELAQIFPDGSVQTFDLKSDGSGNSFPGQEGGFATYPLTTLTGTNGNDILVGCSDFDYLNGGPGNDLLQGRALNDILTGGDGADIFKFSDVGVQNVDLVTDYTFVAGDTIDLTDLLPGFQAGDTASDFVRAVQYDTGLLVEVDSDGAGTGATWDQVALLEGLNTPGTDQVAIVLPDGPHTIVSVPDAVPVVTPGAGATGAVEQVAIAVDSGITVADDDALLASATVYIDAGWEPTDVLAADTTGTNIVAFYDPSQGLLTLEGADTVAAYQAVLRSVTFVADTDTPGTTPRSVEFSVNDGTYDSTIAVKTVDVAAVNDAPDIGGAGGSVAYTEQAAPVVIESALTLDDPDSADLAGATVTISSGAQSGDALAADVAGTAITAHYDAATHVLTLSGSDTLADYEQVLNTVTFANASNDDPTAGGATTRTVTWVVDDGSGSDNLSAPVTSTVAITPVNDPPTGSLTGADPTYTENGPAQAIFTVFSLSTVEAGQNIRGITFTVSNVADGANEIIGFDGSSLALTDGNSVASTTNGFSMSVGVVAGTASVTITSAGGVSAAVFTTLMNGITYADTSDNPSTVNRIVTLTSATDTGGTANGGHDMIGPGTFTQSTITVVAVDDPAVAANDVFTTNNATAIGAGLSLFANNGHGADGDVDGPLPLTIAAVNGAAGNVGTPFTLASGAHLTVNADGTFAYDPNHAFDTLASASSGAANSAAADSFTYTLTGGGTAAVTVTVTGADTASTVYIGDAAHTHITGGDGGHLFDLTAAADYTATGGAGDDGFAFGATFDGNDAVNGGGGGNNQMQLDGNYAGGVILDPAKVQNIQVLAMQPGNDYTVTTAPGFVGAGHSFTFWSVSMGAANHVALDGSAETDGGTFNFYLGQGNDTARGGSGNDVFYGEGGADTLTGGGGADVFAYLAPSDSTGNSTGTAYDTVTDFTAGTDKFQFVGNPVTGVDATVAGALDSANFDTELGGLVGTGQLAAHHAVLVTATSGTLVNHTFLVVDANGIAGYQTGGADYVIDVGTLAGISATDFV
ncbi:MAG: type I secretion C-terminal target domain-containing protein [Rhizomicrobium sp.]